MAEIIPGRYRHYKGNEYTVLGVARHSETLDDLVVYRQEYGERGLWVRPAAMFAETVVVDGKEMPRFAAFECAREQSERSTSAWRWLVDEWNWPAAGLVGAAFLLALLPVLFVGSGLAVLLVAAQLPSYLVHQAEEHIGDRFRRHVNAMMGCEALSRAATFWINSLGVWLVNLISLALMVFVDVAWGLVAVYLTLVNAAIHVLAAVARRETNPGLVTALVLFIPVGTAGLWAVSRLAGVGLAAHGWAAAFVIAVHAGIVGWMISRRSRVSQ